MVALDGLTKRYGAFLAVDQVSFELGKGEILGLLGPNGSGKTTILRMLTGYLRPSAGTAQVAGFDIVRDGRAARGRVGYVPEDAPLYRNMRVNEFLSFMGRLRGLEQEKLRERLAVARERFALQDMGDAIVGRLSRGYRQRVSLAQAVLHEPDLLVLGRADERARSTPDHRIPGADPPGFGAVRDPDHIAYSRGNGAHSRSRGDPAPRPSPCREGFGHGQGVLHSGA